MKKITILLFIFTLASSLLILTGCSNEKKTIAVSSEVSSKMSSEVSSSAASDTLADKVVESSKTPSSNISNSSVPPSSQEEDVGVPTIKSISIGFTNPDTWERYSSYKLTPKETVEFVEHWRGLKLEFLRTHKRISGGSTITPPGYGSVWPCSIGIQYTNGHEYTNFAFAPNYHENGNEYSIMEGAEEMFKFLDTLDSTKKRGFSLYDMWIAQEFPTVKTIKLAYRENGKEIFYPLTSEQTAEFIEHWRGLKLEFLKAHKDEAGHSPPKYGSSFLCKIYLEYTDEQKNASFAFNPNYHEKGNEFSIAEGAEEMFKFLDTLDVMKKRNISSYDMWLAQETYQQP